MPVTHCAPPPPSLLRRQTREATKRARKVFLVSLVFSLPLLVVSMGFRSKEKGGLSEGERAGCVSPPSPPLFSLRFLPRCRRSCVRTYPCLTLPIGLFRFTEACFES